MLEVTKNLAHHHHPVIFQKKLKRKTLNILKANEILKYIQKMNEMVLEGMNKSEGSFFLLHIKVICRKFC